MSTNDARFLIHQMMETSSDEEEVEKSLSATEGMTSDSVKVEKEEETLEREAAGEPGSSGIEDFEDNDTVGRLDLVLKDPAGITLNQKKLGEDPMKLSSLGTNNDISALKSLVDGQPANICIKAKKEEETLKRVREAGESGSSGMEDIEERCGAANNDTFAQKRMRHEDSEVLKRPLSAFFIFRSENRAEVKAANPNGGWDRRMGKMWRKLDDKTKASYKKKAEEARKKYEKAAFEGGLKRCQVNVHALHSPTRQLYHPWISRSWILGEINKVLKEKQQRALEQTKHMEQENTDLRRDIFEMEKLNSDLKEINDRLFLKIGEEQDKSEKERKQHQDEMEKVKMELAEEKSQKKVDQEKYTMELQDISTQVCTVGHFIEYVTQQINFSISSWLPRRKSWKSRKPSSGR